MSALLHRRMYFITLLSFESVFYFVQLQLRNWKVVVDHHQITDEQETAVKAVSGVPQ